MKVPVVLVADLAAFVHIHFHQGGLRGRPADLGRAAGDYVREWLCSRASLDLLEVVDAAALIAWGERFGKHLGSFYSEEKEG